MSFVRPSRRSPRAEQRSSRPSDSPSLPQKASSGAKRERGEGAEIMQDNVGCQKSAAEPRSILEAQRAHLRATRPDAFFEGRSAAACLHSELDASECDRRRRVVAARSRVSRRVPSSPLWWSRLKPCCVTALRRPEWSLNGQHRVHRKQELAPMTSQRPSRELPNGARSGRSPLLEVSYRGGCVICRPRVSVRGAGWR